VADIWTFLEPSRISDHQIVEGLGSRAGRIVGENALDGALAAISARFTGLVSATV
jgi:hypothetical protein